MNIVGYFKPRQNKNIYHCCIQKSGSQWIKKILSNEKFRWYSGLTTYTPDKDYIVPENRQDLSNPFPENLIITPLYLRYDEFIKMPKPEKYKAFMVIRDPRDLTISWYFSTLYAHDILNKSMAEKRKLLSEMSMAEGIMYSINAIVCNPCLASWLKSGNNEKVMTVKYEDMVGKNQVNVFQKIFEHCNIFIPGKVVVNLLDLYSFKKLSGREQGVGDLKSHYRKGIAGDWKNYFAEEHKKAFKEVAGQLLVDLGYEKDLNW